MSATLTTPPRVAPSGSEGGFPRPRRLTLEERLEGAWASLRATGAADCPLCHAPLRRAPDGAGRCASCGSALS